MHSLVVGIKSYSPMKETFVTVIRTSMTHRVDSHYAFFRAKLRIRQLEVANPVTLKRPKVET